MWVIERHIEITSRIARGVSNQHHLHWSDTRQHSTMRSAKGTPIDNL